MTKKKPGSKRYTEEFKEAVVKKVLNGAAVSDVAADHALNASLIYSWLKSKQHLKIKGKTVTEGVVNNRAKDAIVYLRMATKHMNEPVSKMTYEQLMTLLALRTLEGK